MEEGNQQRTSPQQSAYPRIAHQKVLQPSESFIQEAKTTQQPVASPTSTYPAVTTGLLTPSPAATSANEANATSVTESQVPVGMSASQMGLNQSQRDTGLKSLLKPVLTVVVVLMVLGAGLLIYKSLSGYGN